jgi:UDP-N-acetylmuramoyl-tripeptide--D-alanyl-D-alanine ligase
MSYQMIRFWQLFASDPFLYWLVSLLWIFEFTKKLFFWLGLWQLKEYHLARFFDHFRTFKGKKLIFRPLNLVKLFVVLFFLLIDKTLLVNTVFLLFIFGLFLMESIVFVLAIWKKRVLLPVLTKKTLIIISTGLIAIVLLPFFLFFTLTDRMVWAFFVLLAVDLFAPILLSLFILSFQPLTIFLRNRIVRRARFKRERFKNLKVIGITGSYGKSSTKDFLAQILSAKYKVLKTRKNENSEIGIARRILNDLNEEHEIFVCEMGAYSKGTINFVCSVTQPQLGILTGINEQHMATFGSQQKIIEAKLELVKNLPTDGFVVLNGNNEIIKSLDFSDLKVEKKIFCSFSSGVDYWVENLLVFKDKVSFKVVSKNESSELLEFDLIGVQNVENLLLAIACAKELGMTFEEIAGACKKLKALARTMSLKKGINGVDIIDDSYSANPNGVLAALDHLKLFEGKKIIIMPCLIELGQSAKRVHLKIGERIGEICDLAIITSKDYFEQIEKGAMNKGMDEKQILFLEKPKEIFDKIKDDCSSETVILLESRVPQKLFVYLEIRS